jgi:membrane-associated phospholipid phosphatase
MTSDIRTAPKTFFNAFIALSILWVFVVVIFNRFPALDIHTSQVFFSASGCAPSQGAGCGRFVMADLPVVQAMRSILYALPYIAAALLIAIIAACYMAPGLRSRLSLARLWLALISVGLGTGLLTNVILKGHSGRPRPFNSDVFGGSLAFTPAGSFHGACSSNCSFISGEASGAGWMFCLMFLLPPRFRDWAGAPLVAASILTVFLRVAVGAHFLSDVLLGWLLSVIVFCALMSIEEKYPSRPR